MTETKYPDSNVFIRFIVGDVTDHLEKSKEFFRQTEDEKIVAKVSILVVNEVIWILENYYELKRGVYIPQLLNLFALKNIKFVEVRKHVIVSILKQMLKYKFDFTDNYLAEIAASKEIFSFDRDFEKLFKLSPKITKQA